MNQMQLMQINVITKLNQRRKSTKLNFQAVKLKIFVIKLLEKKEEKRASVIISDFETESDLDGIDVSSDKEISAEKVALWETLSEKRPFK
ncbi:hypothetical protein TNIN_356961 [Trichonephila inaurata madagascariensis]|uniref:Uncharacterized protein n=1 Tax=Trichonephila inaurata madagascariensis TaxID=2747483 RepID=A0A8X6JRV5_9ARAC|nr:hypothetical protein TNIN_356961 [Trichonephila inaurata madagascariensis]